MHQQSLPELLMQGTGFGDCLTKTCRSWCVHSDQRLVCFLCPVQLSKAQSDLIAATDMAEAAEKAKVRREIEGGIFNLRTGNRKYTTAWKKRRQAIRCT